MCIRSRTKRVKLTKISLYKAQTAIISLENSIAMANAAIERANAVLARLGL